MGIIVTQPEKKQMDLKYIQKMIDFDDDFI